VSQTLTAPLDVKLMNLTASALFAGFALLVVGMVSGWVFRHPAFAIGGIAVTGDVTHTNVATLRANVASRLGGTFFTIDLAQARQSFEAVPWVRRAIVKRDFPNRLKVSLEEHQAVAYWGGDGDARLLNSFGEVFEANTGEVEQDDLPRLSGPDGQAAGVWEMYKSLQPVFASADMALDQLELTGRGGWRVKVESGAELQLGHGSVPEVMARAQRFLKTLTQVTAQYGRKPDALETADLRYEEGYAIRLRGVTTVIADPVKTNAN
jgi:cell division protein FtsQ